MASSLLYPSFGNSITDAKGVPTELFYRWIEGITARVGRGSVSLVDQNYDDLASAPVAVTTVTTSQPDHAPVCGCQARVERLERLVAALMAQPVSADVAGLHALARRVADLEIDV